MATPVVVDANVVLSGLRSRNGASFVVLEKLLCGELAVAASTAVILEYEAVLKRPGILGPRALGPHDIDAVLDLICLRVVTAPSFFRFRPFLDDPKDDLYVECALAVGARIIVTGDRHFQHPAMLALGLRALSPVELLQMAEG